MATNFPGGIDTFVNPNATSSLDSPSHAGLHTDLGDAMTAVQTQLVNNPTGLVHIETRTVSAVSAENFNNVFTSTFENYKVIIDLTVAVGSPVSLDCRLRVGGSDDSTSNYARQLLSVSSTSLVGQRVSSSNTFAFGNIGTNKSITIVDFFSPQKTSRTQTFSNNSLNGDTILLFNNTFNATTSFDGFTLFPASSTISGKVFIYGYKD
jgi:hypothetical protein